MQDGVCACVCVCGVWTFVSHVLHTRWQRRIQHRKCIETKVQPSRARPGQLLGFSLVSLHFRCSILRSLPVRTVRQSDCVALSFVFPGSGCHWYCRWRKICGSRNRWRDFGDSKGYTAMHNCTTFLVSSCHATLSFENTTESPLKKRLLESHSRNNRTARLCLFCARCRCFGAKVIETYLPQISNEWLSGFCEKMAQWILSAVVQWIFSTWSKLQPFSSDKIRKNFSTLAPKNDISRKFNKTAGPFY